MTTVEQQYRQLVRWYPRSWRTHNSDALLGTLLDVTADQQRTTLTIRERLAVLSLGLLAHLDRLIHPRLRELASTIALTAGAGITAGIVIVSSWAPGGPGHFDPEYVRIAGSYDLSPITATPWLVALVLAAIGRWSAGRWILAASIPLDLVLPHLADALHAVSTDRTTLLLLAATAILAAIGTPDRHRFLAPAAAGWALITLAGYAAQTPDRSLAWQDSSTLWSNIAILWYASAVALIAAAALALASKWTAAATLTLGLAPLAATFALSVLRSELHENGSALLIVAPDAFGLLLIALVSSGHLHHTKTRTPLS